jgi:sterol desaturase/sphingolipid hydroxylase (fatty acid hydroxylase superfamily)
LEYLVQALEPAIRLGFFLGTFTIIALWEIIAPRRALSLSKAVRWAKNPGVVSLNTLVMRLPFPAAAVGMATFAADQGWGLLAYFQTSAWLAIPVAVIAMDFVICLQHIMVHAIPALWRPHRVHHAVADDEANSNFGFNQSWRNRLFGTYKDQPRAGHQTIQIGIHTYRDPSIGTWLNGMLRLPIVGHISSYAINRRQWGTAGEP